MFGWYFEFQRVHVLALDAPECLVLGWLRETEWEWVSLVITE